MKFAIKQQYLSHLRHVATLPWDIKNSNFLQIFSRYGNHANELHFQCTGFNFSACVTVHAEYVMRFFTILSSSLNTMLILDKHCSDVCCDEFPVPQTDRKANK